MSPDRRDPDRVPGRYTERPGSAAAARAFRRSRYSRGPVQSTKSLTAKLIVLAVVCSLVIGGLIAAQMAAGNDPALGPKAVARAEKPSTKDSSGRSSTSSSTGSDPYGQSSGSDGYYYGNPGYSSSSDGYSSGSSGYSSGSSGSTYSAPPVTSSTS